YGRRLIQIALVSCPGKRLVSCPGKRLGRGAGEDGPMTATLPRFFEAHREILDRAIQAIADRSYWSAYPESPSPRVYGETAAADGSTAFHALLGTDFALDQPGQTGWIATESSPYGLDLAIRYPHCDVDALITA